MLPAASNLIPFDIPLGDRKIEVAFVAGSNFQMNPASMAPFSSRETCENVISLKYTIPSGATLTPSVSTFDSNSFSSFASGGTMSSCADNRLLLHNNPINTSAVRQREQTSQEQFSM